MVQRPQSILITYYVSPCYFEIVYVTGFLMLSLEPDITT